MTLAEFIIRIGITGVDRARMGLDSLRSHLRGAGGEASRSAATLNSTLSPALERLGGVAGRAFLGVSAVGGVVGGVFASSAVQSGVAYEQLVGRMEALTGSADLAARKLAFVQAVANPSNFTFSQLSDAAVTMEAFGINAERALPTVARLGMAFGAGSEQLQVLTRGLGDLASGKFLESDVAASFGLNRSMFEAQGIKFDGSGQLQSSATEALTALEAIVSERYGAIFDKMSATGGAKLASLSDAWEKFSRTVGDGILRAVGPSLEMLTQLINAATSSGVLVDVVNALADGMARLLGTTSAEGVTGFMAGLFSALSHIPDLLSAIGTAATSAVDAIGSNVRAVGGYLRELVTSIGTQATAFVAGIIGAAQAVARLDFAGAQSAISGSKMVADAIAPIPTFPSLQGIDTSGFGKFSLLDRQQEFASRLQGALRPVDNRVPDATGEFLSRQSPAVEALGKISQEASKTAKNTGLMSDALSLRRQALGGGDLGQFGATPAELRGGGGSGPAMTPYGMVNVQISDTSPLARALREMIRAEISITSGGGRLARV